jgi:hypothetical protein
MLKLIHPDFYEMYEEIYIVQVGIDYVLKPRLCGKWYTDRRFKYIDDLLNLDKQKNILQNLSMGMKSYWAPAAVYLIKPPCCIGLKVNDIDIILYWCYGR